MYCSASAMLKLAQQRVSERFVDLDHNRADACNSVFEAARNGNQMALKVVREIAEYIGYGCVTLINGYNPDIIVIGDSVSQGGDLLLPTIKEVVRQRTVIELHEKVQIKLSQLKVDSTLYGAAAIATDRVLRRPSSYLAIRE
jgi:predicted NBD/HSP70 family sugar kinase